MGWVSLLTARNQIQPKLGGKKVFCTFWGPKLNPMRARGGTRTGQWCPLGAAGGTLLLGTRADQTPWQFQHLVLLSAQWYLAQGPSIV